MRTRILDCENNFTEWKQLIEKLPEELQDVYFLPEYIILNLTSTTARGCLFVHEDDQKVWLFPFILQEVCGYPEIDIKLFDVESPYGYSGPVSNSDEPQFLTSAHAAYDAWLKHTGVVSVFTRFHPLIANQRWIGTETMVDPDRETVGLNLRSNINDVIADYTAKTRNMIKRPIKSGVYIVDDSSDKGVEEFRRVYSSTMQRKNAAAVYCFGSKYFEGLTRLFPDNGFLLLAKIKDEVIAGACFLIRGRYAHYHLSGSHPERMVAGTFNLLLLKAAEICIQRGAKIMHLGGGTTDKPDDPLLKFKQTMGKEKLVYHVGTRIVCPAVHRQLKALWTERNPSLAGVLGGRIQCYRI